MKNKFLLKALLIVCVSCGRDPQTHFGPHGALPEVTRVEKQPLTSHVQRLVKQLDFLGSPIDREAEDELSSVVDMEDSLAVLRIQEILDPYCLLGVHINPESRVKVLPGPAHPKLYERGSRRFLVKIHNEAGVTAQLNLRYTGGDPDDPQDHDNHPQMSAENDALFHAKIYLPAISWYHSPGKYPLNGLELNYAILDVYCRDEGKRETTFSFDVGQGTQDLGFRAELPVLFTVEPSFPLTFADVTAESGEAVMAKFVIRDEKNRIYPPQSQRIPPDFWFHPQVYRTSGDQVSLPKGQYTVVYGRGPEYDLQARMIQVTDAPVSDFYGSSKSQGICFFIFSGFSDYSKNSMNKFVPDRIQHRHFVFP